MNRAQRRRDQSKSHSKNLDEGIKQLSGSGPLSFIIVPTSETILDPTLDPEIAIGLLEFGEKVEEGGRPLCLTCDYEWTNLRCPRPAAIAAIRTHDFFRDRSGGAGALFSGICRNCWENKKDSLLDLCIDRYREIWPDLRAGDIQAAPQGAQ